ncbi:precorrin-2 C(20)-methyltransferase [Desulfovibrio sp. OttesenSCG-928-C06]|nr:precorrin-2 C(20)-methyltransferase [Desulfovibrio sp. OttesenSCG-928-C06]
MNNKYGTLYGIGVGPGSPDLLTLRAVKTLGQVDVILAASSSKNDYSQSHEIVREHLPANVQVLKMDFPMTSDKEVLKQAWQANLDKLLPILREGRSAAFITLGDPMIYSTFGYLMTLLGQEAPEIPVEVIPGITSFQAAAAETRTILCENSQNLLVIPGIKDKAGLGKDLGQADNAVFLKAYRNLPAIRESLRQEDSNADSKQDRDMKFISRLGLDNQIICKLEDAPEQPNYLSLVLATRKRAI